MLRSIPHRVAVWVAILCLAVTLVALGTAAKHSQFVSPAHGTSYLAQSVKMVTGAHSEDVEVSNLAVCLLEPLTVSRLDGVRGSYVRVADAAPCWAPLLI